MYIAGYTAYSAIKKFKCEYCKVFLTADEPTAFSNLIDANNRGGLCYPHEDILTCAAYAFVIIQKLLENEREFLNQPNQREVMKTLLFDSLSDLNFELFLGHCCPKHAIRIVIIRISHTLSNIFLNNYTKRRNDFIKQKEMPDFKRIKPKTK